MANVKRKMTPDEALVEEMMARFKYAYDEAYNHFERMEEIQKTYDNQIDTVTWPTVSQISFPLTFISIEEQLPFAMKYVFPTDSKFIELIPSVAMDAEKVRRVEDNLRYTLLTEMGIEMQALLSIKDCYKFAVGYGLIDTEVVSPPVVVTSSVSENGAPPIKIPRMALGVAKQQVVYKYIPTVAVVPMPDGANVEGPNKASGHIVLDLKYEDEFRDMMERGRAENGGRMVGDVETIIDDARHLKFHSDMMPIDVLHQLSGLDLSKTNQGDKRLPVIIPILRFYFDHHHVWIANGRTKIYELKDSFQTLRSDLVKWSAWPDGLRWFPLGITEASQRVAWGTNIWYNGMVDLAMYLMNPTRVIDVSKLDDPRSIARGPRADIKVRGNVRDSASYMDLPAMPQQLFQMGDILQQMHGRSNAQVSSVQQGSAGMVRGGSNALETLLMTTTGRQYLAAIILQSGGLKPAIEKTLIKKQLLIDEDGERFVEPAYDAVTGKKYFEEKSVTLEDMRNIFRVELTMPAARLNATSAFQERAAYFDRAAKQPELFDQRALYEELTEDYALVRRTMLPKAVVEKRQEQIAKARVEAIQRGEQPVGAPAPMTEGQQGQMGAMGPVESGQTPGGL